MSEKCYNKGQGCSFYPLDMYGLNMNKRRDYENFTKKKKTDEILNANILAMKENYIRSVKEFFDE